MPTRRQIREAAVQLFYARASSQVAEDDAEIWDLIHDRAGLSFDRARVKVLNHWQNGRRSVADRLLKDLGKASTAIDAVDPTGKAARQFQELADAEIKLAESLENLTALTKADTGGWRQSLYDCFERSRRQKKVRNELVVHVEAFPPLHIETLEPLFQKLDVFDQRLEMVRFPERHPEQRELAHLHKTQSEMQALRDETETILTAVSSQLAELNKTIEKAAENYDLDRLSRVDLSILRLGTWEILFSDDVPPAVAINEAIDLARSFSGEDSAAFVNGLLDRIAKDHAKA